MILIRDATEQDVETIYTMGVADPAFAVSSEIRFYEKTELYEWIQLKEDNILLVAESANIIGFIYCKRMSSHWALLDNYYVRPDQRNQGIGTLLFNALLERLRQRKISYLSTLAASNFPLAFGFCKAKSYDWYELFI